MRKLRRFQRALSVAGLMLAMSVGVPAASVAQSVDNTQPEMLINDVPASGTLVGNRAGAFHYYAIEYPGDLRVVTLEMESRPDDPVTRLGVGFNVYGPNGFFIGQSEGPEEEEDAPLLLQYSDGNAATWLIQVFNYLPGHRIDYTIVGRGLPAELLPSVTVLDQKLAGGTVSVARVTSPGPGWIVVHSQHNGEPDAIIGSTAVPAGTSRGVIVPVDASRATETLYAMLHVDAGTPGVFEFPGPDIPAAVSGQVVPPSFSIALTPGPGPEDGAALHTGASVAGTLPGRASGAFARYTLMHAGGGARVQVGLDFRSDTPAVQQGIGLIIYGPSGEVARAKVTDEPGVRVATFAAAEAGTYLVQVYNYIDGFLLEYAVTRSL